jgi:predicted DNA-binding ribbon-helix-helix protein
VVQSTSYNNQHGSLKGRRSRSLQKGEEMEKIDGIRTAIVLEQYQIDRLNEIAKRFNIKRAEATRRIIDTGLDAYAVYEGLGVVKIAEIIKRTREACEKSVQPSLF